MIDPELAGKVALVTGAQHGIGAATAEAFAAQDARVFVTCHREASPYSAEELEEARRRGVGGDLLYRARQEEDPAGVVERIRAAGGEADALEADLGRTGTISRLFDACEERLGPVGVLVNNHALCEPDTFDPARVTDADGGLLPLTERGIDAHFAVNARASALMMSEFVARYLRRNGRSGCIVNISTDAAHAHSGNVSYAASKHALESFSRSAAAELGRYGIRVNVVAPGPVQTGWLTPDAEASVAGGTPLGRAGRPSDIADVIVFLASAQARWVTGQLIYVGGGWRMGQ